MQRTRFYSATPNAFVPAAGEPHAYNASEPRTYKKANAVLVLFVMLALAVFAFSLVYRRAQNAEMVVKPMPTAQAVETQIPAHVTMPEVHIPVLPLPAIRTLPEVDVSHGPEPTTMPNASKYPAGTPRDVMKDAPPGWFGMPDCKSQGLRVWVEFDPRTGDISGYHCAK